jgi:protein phosphatase
MGGHQAGDYASQCLVGYLYQMGSQYRGMSLVNLIPQVIQKANKEIYHYAQAQGNGDIVGTTATVLLMENDRYHCFWSGDSRCYLHREQEFQALTRDHSEAESMVDQGLLSIEEAEKSPSSNILTDAIGIDETARIDHINGYIYEDDYFLLCTDGINKVFNDQALADIFGSPEADIDNINQQLLFDGLNAGAPDNLTSVIVKVC